MSDVLSDENRKPNSAGKHDLQDGGTTMRKSPDIPLIITTTASDQDQSQHDVNESTAETKPVSAQLLEGNHELRGENEDLGASEQPLMNDISSFLETMHSKNLTLKKLAKRQQSCIEQLTEENEALTSENLTKDAEIKDLRMQTESLQKELRENNSKRLLPKPILRKQGRPRENDTETVLVLSKQPAAAQAKGTSESALPSNDQASVFRSSASSKLKMSPRAKSMSNGTTGHCKTKWSAAGGMKSAMASSHKAAVGRVMQIVRKVNNGNRVPASVASNLYTMCWPLFEGTILALMRPDTSPTIGKIGV